MVHLSYWFRSLLLLGLFFVVLIHDHPSAYAYGGKGIKEEEYGSVGENVVPDQKELVEGIHGTFTRKLRVGGRKLVIDREHEMELKGEASPSTTISTEEKTLGKDQDQSNHQKKDMLSSGRVVSGVNKEHKDEERRELNELVSMMHRDYSKFGRRKPPINNHEPRH